MDSNSIYDDYEVDHTPREVVKQSFYTEMIKEDNLSIVKKMKVKIIKWLS